MPAPGFQGSQTYINLAQNLQNLINNWSGNNTTTECTPSVRKPWGQWVLGPPLQKDSHKPSSCDQDWLSEGVRLRGPLLNLIV